MNLRCPLRKHAVLIRPSKDPGLIEIACPSRWCGREPGVVVLHRFDTSTGDLVETILYREPTRKGH